MSNVIQILERLGKDAEADRFADGVLTQSAASSDLSTDVINALRIGNRTLLTSLMGARTNVFCGVFPAKPDEEESPEEPKDDEKAPADGTTKGSGQYLHRVAIAS